MVDGIAVASLTAESISLTLICIKIVKRYAETAIHARKDTEQIILKAERLRRSFDFLRTTLLELRNTTFDGMEHELSLDQFKRDMKKLLGVLEKLFNGAESMTVYAKLSYPFKKKKIEEILESLQESQNRAIDVIQLLNT